MFIKSLKSSAE